jgi:hypothetical protein
LIAYSFWPGLELSWYIWHERAFARQLAVMSLVALVIFFSSLLSSLSSLHLKYTNPDTNTNFSGSPAAALQSLPHDRSKLDATVIRTINASFDYFIRFKLCVFMLDFTNLS